MINEKNAGGARGRTRTFVDFIGKSGEIGNQPPLRRSMGYGRLDIAPNDLAAAPDAVARIAKGASDD